MRCSVTLVLSASLCVPGSCFLQAQSVVVEHAGSPAGPWSALGGAAVTLSTETMSTARFSRPEGGVHFYRLRGDGRTILWDFTADSAGMELRFTPELPAPVISGVNPASVSAGHEFTIQGEHLFDYGIRPKVYFAGRELEVIGAGQHQLTVRVPREGWERCWNGWITTWMVLIRRDQSAGHNLTIVDVPASPPSDISVRLDAAVQGRVMTVRAEGLSSDPALNLFQFGGKTVPGIAYTPDWMDGYGKVDVRVPDTTPPGATSLRIRRADGDGVHWSDSATFTVHRPTELRVDGFVGMGTRFINPYLGTAAARNLYVHDSDWIISGHGFSTVCSLTATGAGRFEVELAQGDRKAVLTAIAFSDQRARVVHFGASEEEERFLESVQPGQTLALRPLAREKADLSRIEVDPIAVVCDRRQVLGETYPINAPFENGSEFTIHQGAMLAISGDSRGAERSVLSAQGLWDGEVEVQTRWLVPLDKVGNYSLHDLTRARSATVRVVPLYSFSTRVELGDESNPLLEEGIVLGYGGLRLEIPAGALPNAWRPHKVTVIQDYHEDTLFDSVVSDGRRRFSLVFHPEVTELLKPIALTLPYDPEELIGDVRLGKWNSDAHLYFPIPSEPGPGGKRILVFPVGDYSRGGSKPAALQPMAITGPGTSSQDSRRPQLWGYPGTVLGDLLDSLGVWSNNGKTSDLTDEAHKIRVDVVRDPSSSDHVTEDVARRVLEIAGNTHMFLTGRSWTAPGDWTVIYIRDLGNPDDVAGSTTKGVFGQPYVYINSRIKGRKLDTTVAHEMTHAFQRVMTVNLAAKWIDEAVANWAAYDLLGDDSDVATDISSAPDFVTQPIPATFSGGYSDEAQYAASAFIIWLAKVGGSDAPAKIYQAISGQPLNWERARTVLREASGLTMSAMVTDFALAFWGQDYPPVDGLALNIPRREMNGWEGVTWVNLRPEYSSAALDITVAGAFAPMLKGYPLVVRGTGQRVSYRVFGCQGLPGLGPKSMQQVALINSASPNHNLGAYDGRFAYYRIIATNPLDEADPSVLLVVAPHVRSLTPNQGNKGGGYTVHISGSGFGPAAGSVSVGGFSAEVISWTDTTIAFRQINVGDTLGDWPVSVTTAEGAAIPSTTFRFTDP